MSLDTPDSFGNEEWSDDIDYVGGVDAQLRSIRQILYEESPADVEFFLEYLCSYFGASHSSEFGGNKTSFDTVKNQCNAIGSFLKKQGALGIYKMFNNNCINACIFGRRHTLLASATNEFPSDGAFGSLEGVPDDIIFRRLALESRN